MAGSWVRTITSPFRKVFGAQPHKDGGKRPQQPNSGKLSILTVLVCQSIQILLKAA
jgi:hypothetical protein